MFVNFLAHSKRSINDNYYIAYFYLIIDGSILVAPQVKLPREKKASVPPLGAPCSNTREQPRASLSQCMFQGLLAIFPAIQPTQLRRDRPIWAPSSFV